MSWKCCFSQHQIRYVQTIVSWPPSWPPVLEAANNHSKGNTEKVRLWVKLSCFFLIVLQGCLLQKGYCLLTWHEPEHYPAFISSFMKNNQNWFCNEWQGTVEDLKMYNIALLARKFDTSCPRTQPSRDRTGPPSRVPTPSPGLLPLLCSCRGKVLPSARQPEALPGVSLCTHSELLLECYSKAQIQLWVFFHPKQRCKEDLNIHKDILVYIPKDLHRYIQTKVAPKNHSYS